MNRRKPDRKLAMVLSGGTGLACPVLARTTARSRRIGVLRWDVAGGEVLQ